MSTVPEHEIDRDHRPHDHTNRPLTVPDWPTGAPSRGEMLRVLLRELEESEQLSAAVAPAERIAHAAETFGSETAVLTALQIVWRARLISSIADQRRDPSLDPVEQVIAAWRRTAEENPGLRRLLDHYRGYPASPETAVALGVATAIEHAYLARSSRIAPAGDPRLAALGAQLEQQARERPAGPGGHRSGDRRRGRLALRLRPSRRAA